MDNQVLLSKCPVDRVSAIVHGIIDKQCGLSPPSYKPFSDIWSLEEWWETTDSLLNFCKYTSRTNMDRIEIENSLTSLPGEHRQKIVEALLVRRGDLRLSLVEASTAISHAQMRDFDWSTKVVMSSDKMADMREPVVSVDLDVHNNGGNQITSVELNRDDLKKLVTSLEAANRAVLQLKA